MALDLTQEKEKMEEIQRFQPRWWGLTLRRGSLREQVWTQQGIPVVTLGVLEPGDHVGEAGLRVFRVDVISGTAGVKGREER